VDFFIDTYFDYFPSLEEERTNKTGKNKKKSNLKEVMG
jgi:hypothetical protein